MLRKSAENHLNYRKNRSTALILATFLEGTFLDMSTSSKLHHSKELMLAIMASHSNLLLSRCMTATLFVYVSSAFPNSRENNPTLSLILTIGISGFDSHIVLQGFTDAIFVLC